MGSVAPDLCDAARANLPQYQLYANVFKGGRFIRRPPDGTYDPTQRGLVRLPPPYGTYLRPRYNESDDEFGTRIERAAYRNYCQEIVRVYVATVFAEGLSIERQSVLESLGPEISENMDLRGTRAASFIPAAFREALIYGWCGALTDAPRSDAGIVTAADEREAGLRPWTRLVLPMDLWSWERDSVTGDWLELLIHEGYHTSYRDDQGMPQNVWLRLFPDGWEVIDSSGNVLDGGGHTLGRIPFDVLVCDAPSGDRDDEPFGHSALRDVADLQIELYSLSSDDEDLLSKANSPFIHEKVAASVSKKVAKSKPLGVGWGWQTPNDVSWVQPDSIASQTNARKLRDIEQQIRQIAGIATRSEESTEAHSGAALKWEYSTKHSLIKLRAESLRDFEIRLWRTYERILDRDLCATSVAYPSEYATAPVPQEIQNFRDLRESGAPIEIQRAMLRSITLKQFAHRKDLSALLAAVEEWDGGSLPGVDAPAATAPTDTGVDLSEAVPQETALNGAQVTSMQGILESAAQGQLPRESAIAMLAFAFPMDTATAEKILGPIGNSWSPAPSDPEPEPEPIAEST